MHRAVINTVRFGPTYVAAEIDCCCYSYANLWTNLLLDYVAGSGFKSKHAYRNGYFATRIKLPAGYTAGTNTAFYVSTTHIL